jgi:hypothetical protein
LLALRVRVRFHGRVSFMFTVLEIWLVRFYARLSSIVRVRTRVKFRV